MNSALMRLKSSQKPPLDQSGLERSDIDKFYNIKTIKIYL